MITFTDGPAAGVVLSLARAPPVLRVVRSARGEFDALDQPDDEAKPGESIHVYRATEQPTWVHLDYRDGAGRRRGRTEWHGKYRLWPDQPGDGHTRDNAVWRAWCDANRAALVAGSYMAEGGQQG